MFSVYPEAIFTSESINRSYEIGEVATLELMEVGDSTYQWQFNGGDLPGEVSRMLIISDVTLADGGQYSCTVSNVAGNDTASTFLYISPYFTRQPTDRNAQNNEAGVTLQCIGQAFPSPQYQWRRVDGKPIREVIVSSNSTLLFDPVLFGDEGGYYCELSSLQTTISSQNVTLTSKLMNKLLH